MTKKSDPTQPTSLRNLALDHIGSLADALRKADPSLTREKAVAKAVTLPEGREAHRIYNIKGSELPWDQAIGAIIHAELKKQAPVQSMRDSIIAKRALAKEGGDGGSGPRGSTTESPVTSGRRTPADRVTPPAQPSGRKLSAPIDPAATLLTAMHEQAQAAFPDLSPAQAFVKFMSTDAGAKLHRQYQAHHAAQAARA
jgi:hypothetical protein